MHARIMEKGKQTPSDRAVERAWCLEMTGSGASSCRERKATAGHQEENRTAYRGSGEVAVLLAQSTLIGCLPPTWGITPALFTIVNVLCYNLA